MITLQELSSYLKDLLQINLFSDGCPNGLQVEGEISLKSLETDVSISFVTIEAAIENKAEALIGVEIVLLSKASYL